MTLVAEQGVIFALFDAELAPFEEAAAVVREHDFSDRTYRAAWRAMARLHARGARINADSVHREIRDAGELGDIDPAALIVGSVADVVFPENLVDYARRVRESSQLARFRNELVATASERFGSADEMRAAIAKLTAILDDGVELDDFVTLHEALPAYLEQLDADRRRTEAPGVPFGITSLDAKTHGLRAGDLVILAGRPGDGKTALALQVATSIAERGFAVPFFSLEMTANQLVGRLVSACAEVNGRDLRDPRGMSDETFAHIERRSHTLPELLIIRDQRASMRQIETTCRRVRRREGRVGAVFVDYLDLIATPREERHPGRHDLELGDKTSRLKGLAKELGCPVVLLVQLSRDVEKTNRAPTKADLKNSGCIEQDADLVLLLHRERKQDGERRGDDVKVIIDKQRGGIESVVTLRLRGEFTRFEEMAERAMPGLVEPDRRLPREASQPETSFERTLVGGADSEGWREA